MEKILIDGRALQTYSKYRGIGRYTKQIIELFKDNDDFVFLFFGGNDIPSDINNTIKIKYPRKLITFSDKIFLNNYLRRENIGVYHSPVYGLPPKTGDIDMFLTVHDLTPLKFPEFFHRKIKIILKMIIKSSKNAKKIIVDSISTKNDILNYFPKIRENKIKVVYPMIDSRLCQSERKIKLSLPEQYLLYAGGVDRVKNVNSIIEAVRILKIPLVLAGGIKEEDKRKILKDLTEKEKKLFYFTGFISDEELSYLYKRALILMFLSLNEGFGYPPLEALMCGTVSVLSDRGSLKEVMGESGIYVNDPFNIEEIVEKIRFVLDNNEIRDEIIKQREKILRKYSPRNFKENLLNIYNL
jgi:glycosyltransferase involved in cell wall biosynthesis